MNDLEINKALALAIGWEESDFHVYTADSQHEVLAIRLTTPEGMEHQKVFDYREVIEPIAERFGVQVHACGIGSYAHAPGWPLRFGMTREKAIALAVIESQAKA